MDELDKLLAEYRAILQRIIERNQKAIEKIKQLRERTKEILGRK